MIVNFVTGLQSYGGKRSGQKQKKPKDLSTREREERVCGEGVCVYPVCRILLKVRDLHTLNTPVSMCVHYNG